MKDIEEQLMKAVREGGVFMCDENTPYIPENLPVDAVVAHKLVDHFENGDVICPNCKYVLAGPNQNI